MILQYKPVRHTWVSEPVQDDVDNLMKISVGSFPRRQVEWFMKVHIHGSIWTEVSQPLLSHVWGSIK